MKKITLIIALFAALVNVGCYEDKSTLADNPIDGVELSRTTEEKVIRVGYLEQIDIVPNITKGGKTDLTGLEFEWAINLLAGDMADQEYKVIGNEKELHTAVENGINSDFYYLRLLVTDTLNDNLQYSFLYNVYIQPSMLDGLLICDTKDGATSDFNLVMNNQLTSNYSKEEKIFRNILSTKGESYPSLIKSLEPTAVGSYPGDNLMWVIDENGQAGYYNTEDYSFAGMDKCFVYAPESVSVVTRLGQMVCISTDLGFFAAQYINFSVTHFGWINPAVSAYPIDNAVYASHSGSSIGEYASIYALGAWFCDEADAFISADVTFQGVSASLINNTTYDLTNSRAVAGAMSVDGFTPTFLLKDEKTGDYTIYVIERQKDAQGNYDENWNWIETAPAAPSGIRMAYTVPAEGKALLDKAVAVDFACLESIIYVATADGVYTINFAGTTPTVNSVAQFTTSGETITDMKLYQQGGYIGAFDESYDPNYPDSPCWQPLALNNRAVIVTTQKGDEGVVYVVPMIQFGTGNLDASSAVRYDGFGRILAVSTTVY